MDAALDLLLLKVSIAPAFIGLLSWIAQRYGHRTAGWLVALPVNTGSVLLVLALTEGTPFASGAALGALLGVVSLSVFSIGYARSTHRFTWPICLAIAAASFTVSTAILTKVPEIVELDLAAAVAALIGVLALLPKPGRSVSAPPAPGWEIPLRMLTAALLVLTITTLASALGPQLSGLLSPVPVFTITLVIFTHSRYGPAPVLDFLAGLLYGMFGFAAFCAVAAVLIEPYGIAIGLSAGLAAFLAVFALARWLIPGASREGRSSSETSAPGS